MGGEADGPFWSHTQGYSPGQMADALQHLDRSIKEMGQFDAALGFSQGAATLISYIFDQQVRCRRRPFKFALLFSSVCAFSSTQAYAEEVVKEIQAKGGDFRSILESKDLTQSLSSGACAFVTAYANVILPLREAGALYPDIDMDVYRNTEFDETPRLLIPEIMGEKIGIPTVHAHGKNDADFMRAMTTIAHGMFDGKLIKKLEHSGGHEPPQKDSEVRAVVRAMDWAIKQAQRMGSFS